MFYAKNQPSLFLGFHAFEAYKETQNSCPKFLFLFWKAMVCDTCLFSATESKDVEVFDGTSSLIRNKHIECFSCKMQREPENGWHIPIL